MFGGCQFFDGKTFFCAYSKMCFDSNNSHHTWAKMPSVITALCTSTRICDVSIFRWPPTILHVTADILQLEITITMRNSKRHELTRKFFHSVCGQNAHRLSFVICFFLSLQWQCWNNRMINKCHKNGTFALSQMPESICVAVAMERKFEWKATFNVQKATRRQVLFGWNQFTIANWKFFNEKRKLSSKIIRAHCPAPTVQVVSIATWQLDHTPPSCTMFSRTIHISCDWHKLEIFDEEISKQFRSFEPKEIRNIELKWRKRKENRSTRMVCVVRVLYVIQSRRPGGMEALRSSALYPSHFESYIHNNTKWKRFTYVSSIVWTTRYNCTSMK